MCVCIVNTAYDMQKEKRSSYPLLSMSNILKATEKLDSGMLRRVTKNIYLVSRKKSFCYPNYMALVLIQQLLCQKFQADKKDNKYALCKGNESVIISVKEHKKF